MKRFLIATALLLFAVGSYAQGQSGNPEPAKPNNRIKAKYDKGKDVTTVTLKSMAISGAMAREVTSVAQAPQLTLEAFFTHPGEQLKTPVAFMTMRFTSRARYPVFQKPQSAVAAPDNTVAIPLGTTTYKTDAQTFYTDEILQVSVPLDAMQRLTSATSPRIFLGNREITFRSEQLRDLRDLTARMSP